VLEGRIAAAKPDIAEVGTRQKLRSRHPIDDRDGRHPMAVRARDEPGRHEPVSAKKRSSFDAAASFPSGSRCR
jgi:hypothetical protein